VRRHDRDEVGLGKRKMWGFFKSSKINLGAIKCR